MILNISHNTVYSYSEPIIQGIQVLRLSPSNQLRQRVISWDVKVKFGVKHKFVDCFGNISYFLNITKHLQQIEIIVKGSIETFPAMPNNELGPLPKEYYLRSTPLSSINDNMKRFVQNIMSNSLECSLFDKLVLLSQSILAEVAYLTGSTNVYTTASEAFEQKRGVCQDHTHIFLACCRYLKIPARYVSGYLYTDDTTHVATHAWAEAWIDEAWYSFDVSNQCSAGENYVELAYGLDYLDAAPARGVRVGGGMEQLAVLSLVQNISQQ